MAPRQKPLVGLPARCLVIRDLSKPDKRWHFSDHHSVTIFAAVDFWDVLRAAHRSGFELATISDGGELYAVTICEME